VKKRSLYKKLERLLAAEGGTAAPAPTGTMSLERCQSEWTEIDQEYQQLQVWNERIYVICVLR